MKTLGSPSKPSRTLPPQISSTVTVTMGWVSFKPPMAIDSCSFLVKTSIAKLPLWLMAWFNPVPRIFRHAVGKQKHLHHGAGREDLHDGSGGCLDFRGRLANLYAGDFLDLLLE